MDSCSEVSGTSDWSKSAGSHTKGDVSQVQQLQRQVEILQLQNGMLKANLDSANSQLQQASENNKKINELQDERVVLNREISSLNAKIQEDKNKHSKEFDLLVRQYDDEKAKSTTQIDNLNREITRIKQRNNELQIQVDELTSNLAESQSKNKASEYRINHLTKTRAKLNQQNKEMAMELERKSSQLNEATSANDEFDVANRELNNQKEALEREVEKLKSQLHTVTNLHSQAEVRATTAEDSLEELRETVKQQSAELTDVSNQRAELVRENKELKTRVSSLDADLEATRNENKVLVAKTKKLSSLSPAHFGDVLDVRALQIPFEDPDTKDKVETILSYQHFQPTQKIQLIFNELHKEIQLRSQMYDSVISQHETYKDSTSKVDERANKLTEILNSLLTQWKNLEFNERQVSSISFCLEDQRFLDLIAKDGINCHAFIESANILGSLFTQADLFAEESEPRRREILQKVADQDKDLATLISAMFLINTRLNKQIAQLLEGSMKKSELDKALSSIGCEDIQSAPAFCQDLLNQISHLKDTRKEIHKSLRSARDDLQKREQEQFQLNDQIKELQGKIEVLQEEKIALEGELRAAQNEILIKRTELTQVAANATDNEVHDLRDKVKALQKTVCDYSEENNNLKAEIENLRADYTMKHEDDIKLLQQRDTDMSVAIKLKDEEMRLLHEKLERTRKKARAVIRDMKSEHESEVNRLAGEIDHQKLIFADSLESMKNKCHEAKSSNKELTDNVASLEVKNQELSTEQIRLQKALKDLEARHAALLERTARESQDAKASHATELLSIESRYQRECAEMRNRLTKEKNDFVSYIKSKLGSLYGIVDFDIDDSSMDQLFQRISSDLGKLKFFQQEATKI